MREMQSYYPDVYVKEQNHDKDHAHMMIIPLKYSIGKIVKIIKANTSRRMKKEFEFLKNAITVETVFGRTDTLFRVSD
jgi:REP element-mobilizing transposase RayT